MDVETFRPISHIIFMSRITDALRAARIAANLTQDDLARALGITQGFLSDIENGRRELPDKHYEKLPIMIRRIVVEAAIIDLQERTEDRINDLRALIQ